MNKESEIIVNKLKPLFEVYNSPVLFAYLFGSQAKGKADKLSDIDIAVFFGKNTSESEKNKFLYDFEEKTREILPFVKKTDIVILNDTEHLTPLLEKEIVYNGILIYCKDKNARAHFESLAIAEWLDWEPYKIAYDKAILK